MHGQGQGLTQLHAHLRDSGQRLTPQRLLILELLYAHGDHATADRIFAAEIFTATYSPTDHIGVR